MMPFFVHDDLTFHFRESGSGTPFVFQHGLGGDVNQPFGLFRPPAGIRLLSIDCRAHGETRPLGDLGKICITSFADDLSAFLDMLGVQQAIVGGISLGAAVALNFTLRYPDRVLAIVMSRPAWLAGPMVDNARIYGEIAELIRAHGAAYGRALFEQSPTYADVARQSPDGAQSLLMQFENPRAEETVMRLEQIPHNSPLRDLRELGCIHVPTLILANREDPIHPLSYGRELSRSIRESEFREITSKSVSPEHHTADVQRFIADFLQRHFLRSVPC